MTSGGKRTGAGRKTGEPTKQVRVPESLIPLTKELIRAHKGKGDKYTPDYLIMMLDSLGHDEVWGFDLKGTLGGIFNRNLDRELRDEYFNGPYSTRVEHIYKLVEGEI